VTPPVLVDSHAHVAEPEFEADRAAVLARAAAAGVTTIVCVGATGGVDTNAPAVALAGEQDGVRIVASVGIHPHDAVTADDAAFETLRGLAGRPGVVALGETGLDYHYDHSPRLVQLEAFARTAALARSLDLPLVVHVRDAHADAVGVLRSEPLGPAGGVIHCFTGGAGDVGPYLDLGLHLSISGIVTFRNADTLREAARAIPLDRLLIETDSPYLAPVPNRGKRNEPAHVRLVAEALAHLRGEPFDVLAATTTANALRLFRLAHKGT
jgi:TatD DNase family protein